MMQMCLHLAFENVKIWLPTESKATPALLLCEDCAKEVLPHCIDVDKESSVESLERRYL